MSDSPATDLGAALVGAFVAYVEATRRARGYDRPSGWDDALATGRDMLDRQLGDLLAQPFTEQRRSPLELFQEALREPTRILADASTPQPVRDPGKVRALPGDLYDLAPASSQELGEDVWRAHLAWGAAKAAAITAGNAPSPRVGYLGTNLMDRSAIESAAQRSALAVEAWSALDDVDAAIAVGGLMRVFIDLTHPAADDAIRRLAATRTRVVAFGPHVDDFAMTRAASLGADEVVPRSRFFRKLKEYLPDLV